METYAALSAIGLERVVRNELDKLDIHIVQTNPGKVIFTAEPHELARAHFSLRVCERILLQAGSFPAYDFDDLFNGVKNFPWEEWIRKDARVVIEKVRLSRSRLTNIPSVQSVAQKAIFDRLCKVYKISRLPESGKTIAIRLYIENNTAFVGIDMSGDALHKRGYRSISGPAPLKETIAAGIILLSGWKRKYPLHDPFCGTGTIPIEAALYAFDHAPNLERAFAFEDFPYFSSKEVEKEREKARQRIKLDYETHISGSDKDREAIEAAITNIRNANMQDKVKIYRYTMEELKKESEGGYLICNPPYGDRLGDPEWAQLLYRQMRHFKKDFEGWKLNVVTTQERFPDEFDAPALMDKIIQNGQDTLHFYQFQL